MSDLSLQLQQAASQLPVSSYFDEALFAREMATIFQRGPRYVGHQLSVPNVGDYHALPQEGEGRALLRTPHGVDLVSNVCRHRQAVILRGRGNVNSHGSAASGGSIVCPLHRWTYSAGQASPAGTLLGAPHFPDNPCLNLSKPPLQNWQGLLFAGKRDIARDLAKFSLAADFDFSGYVLDHVQTNEYQQNWKSFIEVYLEDYHVMPFHPGLGNFVSCDNLRWEMGDTYNVQVVGVRNGLQKAGTPVYQKWHEAVRKYSNGQSPKYGAVWMLYYPNIMLEWYPHVLVVSTLIPRTPQHTTNVVEFYYPEEIALFEREFVEAERAAYMETAHEDDIIALRMDRGRRVLMERGENEVGPYQSPMEDGMMQFHEYLRSRIAPQL